MILIEALKINSGGGAILLQYLLRNLDVNRIEYFLLIDERYSNNYSVHENSLLFKSNVFNRPYIIKKYIKLLNPSLLLCFGNFPPASKFKQLKVITYFQNNLLIPTLHGPWLNVKDRFSLFLKSVYLKMNLKNSDYYIFQTDYVSRKFVEYYKPKATKTEVYPFFDECDFIEKIIYNNTREENSFIYVSSGSTHKNHKNLFIAWGILGDRGLFPKLIVTLPKGLYDVQINLLKSKGCNISNVGNINSDDVNKINLKSEFTIFPSFIESIGLGIVEGIYCGTKIISSNLPYLDDIVQPTLFFDPLDPYNMAAKVEYAIKNKDKLKDSKLVIKNQINDFIDFLQREL